MWLLVLVTGLTRTGMVRSVFEGSCDQNKTDMYFRTGHGKHNNR